MKSQKQTKESPTVTVLMPAYNAASYIREAINSILGQTYTSFELLIIDDASTDQTVKIAKTYTDKRIRIERNLRNLRLAGTLNKALKIIQSDYIIRMDADDISRPHRIGTLINHMEANPEIDICSSWLETFGNGKKMIMKFPVGHKNIKSHLLFNSPIAHAASIWRLYSLKKHKLEFDPQVPLAQDYDFWEKASPYLTFDNIPEPLYNYRHINVHKHYQGQQKIANSIRERQLQKLGIISSQQEKNLHHSIARGELELGKEFLKQVDKWLSRLKSANKKQKVYPKEEFEALLEDKWFAIRAHSLKTPFRKHLALYKSRLFDTRYKLAYGKSNLNYILSER